MAGLRARLLIALCPLLLGLGTAGAANAANAPDYPHLIDQQHVGGQCTPNDTMVAGGTIVGLGGQVVAGGGGTGIGCDTFYAYEIRTGTPEPVEPFVEPGLYLNPGGAARALPGDAE